MKKLILIFILLSTTLFGDSFDKGNEHFSKKEYIEAEGSYLKDLEGGESFSTYYNLSRLSYINDKDGYGKYYLLKARELSPRDKDLIDLTKEKVISRDLISFKESITLLLILILILTITVLNNNLYPILKTVKVNLKYMAYSLPIFALLIISTIITYRQNDGVILENTTPLVSPYKDSDKSFNLEEGEVVKILDNFKEYYKIDHQNRLGWIHKSEIGTIWSE